MTAPKFGLTSLLVLLTVISSVFNCLLSPYVRRLSVLFEKGTPQERNFEYSPIEVPGSFSATVMTLEVPDTQYPMDDHHKWASIVPEKRGFIRLGPDGHPFSIALYHQLHCVNALRFTYVTAREGLFKTEEQRSGAFGHANHCLDVLRHSVLCKTDTTLLPAGSSREASVARRCRNSTQVLEYVHKNQAFWEGIPYTMAPSPQTSKASWDSS
ncbi:hypothetical protein DFH07DRAFT_798177 [Mycena maculata]|uniref:Oxidase ustYa n=1 Tax=Mycena maculata TaxID=230809 RepID=A0AAD7K2J9_9AGAR|nr:hypothetical protein DFH07DRAFT_798177 [Mycena maculata]